MDQIESDRAVVKSLNLAPSEIALLCAHFQDQGILFHAPFFLSMSDEAVHVDSKGTTWRVDTKELARKLSATGLEERRALTRGIFRFWDRYPREDPALAMRMSGLI